MQIIPGSWIRRRAVTCWEGLKPQPTLSWEQKHMFSHGIGDEPVAIGFIRIFQIRKHHLQCQPQWMRTRVLYAFKKSEWRYKSEPNIQHETQVFHWGKGEEGDWGVDLKEHTEILSTMEEIFSKVNIYAFVVEGLQHHSTSKNCFFLHSMFFISYLIFDKGLFIYYVIQFGGLGRPPPHVIL